MADVEAQVEEGKVFNFDYGNFDIEKFNFENDKFEFNFDKKTTKVFLSKLNSNLPSLFVEIKCVEVPVFEITLLYPVILNHPTEIGT